MSQAIFMVGEQRSGSNLLRLMVEQAGIAAPHPPHILTRMMPLMEKYGDLNETGSWTTLVEDVCRLVERNPVPWEGVQLDREQISSRCREKSLVAVFGALMDQYAQTVGASAWLCKSMQYVLWSEDLDAYFGAPKYIYLYRDGRDVTLSFTKAVVGDKHPYFIAKKWAELQMACLEARDRIGPERFFSLCYEDLTRDPEPILRDLCDFLNVPFSEEMLNTHQSKGAHQAAQSSTLWSNLNKPLMRDNTKKFLRDFSEAEVRIIESVAGEALEALGYERVFVPIGAEEHYSEDQIKDFSMENQRLIQEKRSEDDPADLERRRFQLEIIDEIKAR